MEIKHFESMYPENSRFSEIERILSFIKEGNSVELISVPGVGRSNLLGLLAYNHNVRIRHLGKNQKWFHFVYLNFSEVKGKSLFELNKFIFISLADSFKERGMLVEHDKIHKLFKEHLALNDEMVLFQGLKEVFDYLAIEKKLTVILLFDRFEDYIPSLSEDFFANLRILRNRSKYRFSTVFSLTRPIEEAIEALILAPFHEFLADHFVYLPLKDKPGFEFRLSYLQKITGKRIDPKLAERMFSLTGGHGKLTRLSEEIVLADAIKENISEEKLIETLLSRKSIQNALSEIWDSLIPSEQKNLKTETANDYIEKVDLLRNTKITIPLLEKYIQNRKDTGEKIYFDQQNKEIKRGDQIISDKLTGLELKLLKYLLLNKDRVIDRDEIIKAVWSDSSSTAGVTDQALDQLIFRLRKKIEEDPNSPANLLTIKGRGFKFSS